MTLDALRQLFPHTTDLIYLNHAAVAPLSRPVVAAIDQQVEERHRTHIDNFTAFQPIWDETKSRLARTLGTRDDRVAVMPNTSWALNVLAGGLDWHPGDRIALPACEFPSNVYPFMNLQHRGVEVDFIPHTDGTFTLRDMEAAITPRTRLLTLSYVQFISGFRADLAAVGALCRAHDLVFSVDGIQGVGALQLDVEALGIDFLACGGHKWLMAGQGIGFLYCSERLQPQLQPPAGWLHGPVDWERFFDYDLTFFPDARRFDLGTANQLGIAAMHAAQGLYHELGPAWCEERVLGLAQYLARGLDRLGFARYGTADPAHASGIVAIHHPEPDALLDHLRARGIVASVRNRLVRFAPTWYNSEAELDATLEAIKAFGRVTILPA